MRIIGLCGRSGSGKTVFCKAAALFGFKVIDCDKVYASLVEKRTPCLDEIEACFGSSAVKNNALDRASLANIVFSDKEKLSLLNRISHKYVISEVEKIISSSGENDTLLLDAPTLFESGLDKRCELIIAVIADDELSVQRLVLRDNITEQQARKRLSNQKDNEFLITNCDMIIYNEGDISSFENDCIYVCRRIKEDAV